MRAVSNQLVNENGLRWAYTTVYPQWSLIGIIKVCSREKWLLFRRSFQTFNPTHARKALRAVIDCVAVGDDLPTTRRSIVESLTGMQFISSAWWQMFAFSQSSPSQHNWKPSAGRRESKIEQSFKICRQLHNENVSHVRRSTSIVIVRTKRELKSKSNLDHGNLRRCEAPSFSLFRRDSNSISAALHFLVGAVFRIALPRIRKNPSSQCYSLSWRDLCHRMVSMSLALPHDPNSVDLFCSSFSPFKTFERGNESKMLSGLATKRS